MNSIARRDAASIFQAGVAAADPYQAVKRHLVVKRFDDYSKVHLIAFGKAACAMARAAIDIIPSEKLAGNGIVVTNYANVVGVENVDVIGAAHPLPDLAGVKAARIIADRVGQALSGELVLILISGGGSALIPYPVEQITLEEKIATTDLLLASGATINQINCVRKHLSQLKGGGLAGLAMPASLQALILSDVLGDDVSAIASGPTVADPTTFADAIAVFKCKAIWEQAPANVRHYLEQGKLGHMPETPKPGDVFFNGAEYTLIGSNAISVNAMLTVAKNMGYEAVIYSDHLCGEARDEAERLVVHAKNLTLDKPIALLAGGETTVTVQGNGRGGRNQEMALAFAIAADRHGLKGNWTFLSAGTDGLDGPTDAAGGIVDQNTVNRMVQAGINPVKLLENNDSNTALKMSDDLVITGATGTNVADLQVLLIWPEFK